MLRTVSASFAALLVLLACDARQPPPQPPAPPAAPAPAPAPAPVCNYIVLVDASSSATRALTFAIDLPAGGGAPTSVEKVGDARQEPGLSAFKAEPDKAGAHVEALLAADGGALAAVPKDCLARTPTAVMATAGMRLLAGEDGGADAAEKIYAGVRERLTALGLDVRFVGAISGQQEALYAWLTANHALGRLAGDGPTVGVLDLGGASTQIAFVPEDPAAAPTLAVELGARRFAVYAESYLGYGQDVARAHLSVPACDPKGLGKGAGRYQACVAKLEQVVRPRSCAAAKCGLSRPGDAARPGVPQPPLPAGMPFYATSAYHYTRAFFALPEQTTPAALREAAGGPNGAAGFCGGKWSDITAAHPDEKPQRLAGYCFAAAWIDVLLRSFGFAAGDPITFTDRVGDADAGWALGAALCSLTGCLRPAGGA